MRRGAAAAVLAFAVGALELQARVPAMKLYAALRARGAPGVQQLVRGAAAGPQ